MRKITFLLAAAVALALACSDKTPTGPDVSSSSATVRVDSAAVSSTAKRPSSRAITMRGGTRLPLPGVWGGDDIGITIMTSGASVEYDCAAGSIDAPLVTDTSGHFDLLGFLWFTPPVLSENWQPDKRPARYSGFIDGNTMYLTVTRLDDNQVMWFILTRDTSPRLFKCV